MEKPASTPKSPEKTKEKTSGIEKNNVENYLAEKIFSDFENLNSLEIAKVAQIIIEEAEKKQREGKVLLKKEGITWIWQDKDGSIKGEIIPGYEKYKQFLKADLKNELERYKTKQERSREKAQEKRAKRMRMKLFEERKNDIIEQIVEDFKAEQIQNENFWKDVYGFIEEGFDEYKKLESGFVLINKRNDEFIYFSETGEGTKKADLKTEDIHPDFKALLEKGTKIKEIMRKKYPEENVFLDEVCSPKFPIRSFDFDEAVKMMDGIAEENPTIRAHHEEIRNFMHDLKSYVESDSEKGTGEIWEKIQNSNAVQRIRELSLQRQDYKYMKMWQQFL